MRKLIVLIPLIFVLVACGDTSKSDSDTALNSGVDTVKIDSTTVVSAPISKWTISRDTSAMDDSKSVTIFLKADSILSGPLGYRGELATLVIRCKEHQTDLYINNGRSAGVEYGLMDEATVKFRLDSDKPVSLIWSESTNDQALFAPNPIAFARGIVNGTTLVYEYTPFNENPARFIFTLTGMKEPLQEVASTCGWKLTS